MGAYLVLGGGGLFGATGHLDEHRVGRDRRLGQFALRHGQFRLFQRKRVMKCVDQIIQLPQKPILDEIRLSKAQLKRTCS